MMITSHGLHYLSGNGEGNPYRIVKTYKPEAPFVQWLQREYIYSSPLTDPDTGTGEEVETDSVYYVTEIAIVQEQDSEVLGLFAHIFDVIPATLPPKDGQTKFDPLSGKPGAEIGWVLASRKWTFKLPKDVTVLLEQGERGIDKDESLAEDIKREAAKQATLENEAVSLKTIYTNRCVYPYMEVAEGDEGDTVLKPTWVPAGEDVLAPFRDTYNAKVDLVNKLIKDLGFVLSSKDQSKAAKDKSKASKSKKGGGSSNNNKAKSGGTGGGMGLLAIAGIAIAAYIYSQNKG